MSFRAKSVIENQVKISWKPNEIVNVFEEFEKIRIHYKLSRQMMQVFRYTHHLKLLTEKQREICNRCSQMGLL